MPPRPAAPGTGLSSTPPGSSWPLVFLKDARSRPLPLEGPHQAPRLQSLGAAPASPPLVLDLGGPRAESPPAPLNPSFYAGLGRAATRPPCLIWTSLRTLLARPVAQRRWDTGEKSPGNERPQRCTTASGSAGGVGVYWGEWSLCRCCPLSLPSRTLLTGPRAALGRDQLSLPQVPRPSPVFRCARSRLELGGSQGVLPEAAGNWAPSRRLTRRKCRFFTRLSGMPRVPKKPGLAVLCLFFSLPRRYQELGTAEPRPLPAGGDPNSLLRSFLLWRLQCRGGGGSGCAPLSVARPLPAPGELGQRPRDAGAAGLRAPAPQLAGPAAPGRRGGGGGQRCALLETRC